MDPIDGFDYSDRVRNPPEERKRFLNLPEKLAGLTIVLMFIGSLILLTWLSLEPQKYFSVVDQNRNFKSNAPETPPQDETLDCPILKAQEQYLAGTVVNLKEKESTNGNTYYTFKINNTGCVYPAFSWNKPPTVDSFYGIWEKSPFGSWQFRILDEEELDKFAEFYH